MPIDFDTPIDRRCSDSSKWNYFDQDVLPFWTADMDFRSPQAVIEALKARVDHGVFGYCLEPPELKEIIVDRLARRYDWQVRPEEILFLPSVITGYTRTCRMATSPGDGILVQTPIFPPILHAPEYLRLARHEAQLVQAADGRYEIDYDAFEQAITPSTRVFILCNPHNPVGRVFARQELFRLAEICLRHDVLICSDEIHCDFVYPGHRHIPIASLVPEIARKTVTLMAPTKTFNLPGLRCSMAIVPDPELRERFLVGASSHHPEVNALGFVAAQAAYQHGQDWLDQALRKLELNRDLLCEFTEVHLPGVNMTPPEATYLAWLDCRQAGIPGNAFRFFLEEARVGLTDGADFGRGGEGFVRLNFATQRPVLEEALNRMRTALQAVQAAKAEV